MVSSLYPRREYLSRLRLTWAIFAQPAVAGPHYPGDFTPVSKLHVLKERVKAKKVPFVDACASPRGASTGPNCTRTALSGTLSKLKSGQQVKILHLGDSHVASDYITGMARDRLPGDARRRLGVGLRTSIRHGDTEGAGCAGQTKTGYGTGLWTRIEPVYRLVFLGSASSPDGPGPPRCIDWCLGINWCGFTISKNLEVPRSMFG